MSLWRLGFAFAPYSEMCMAFQDPRNLKARRPLLKWLLVPAVSQQLKESRFVGR